MLGPGLELVFSSACMSLGNRIFFVCLVAEDLVGMNVERKRPKEGGGRKVSFAVRDAVRDGVKKSDWAGGMSIEMEYIH